MERGEKDNWIMAIQFAVVAKFNLFEKPEVIIAWSCRKSTPQTNITVSLLSFVFRSQEWLYGDFYIECFNQMSLKG